MIEADSNNTTPRANGEPEDLVRLLRGAGYVGEWPDLERPKGGETWAEFVGRCIIGHPAVVAITKLGQLKPLTLQGQVRPAERTFSWWKDTWRDTDERRLSWYFDRGSLSVYDFTDHGGHTQSAVLAWYRDQLVSRLFVVLFDLLKEADLVAHEANADGPQYHSPPAEPWHWRHPSMSLDMRTGSFGPEPSLDHGHLVQVAGLPSYAALSLRIRRGATEALATPPSDPRPKPTDAAVRQWMRERVAGWPKDKHAPSEDHDFKAATSYFGPELSREEFRLVRMSETPLDWRKQGPRLAWGKVK